MEGTTGLADPVEDTARHRLSRCGSLTRRLAAPLLAFLLVLFLAKPLATSATARERFASPDDVWRGYDPEALPLDVEVTKSWEEDGCAYQKLTITGEVVDGFKTRIFAIQGAPVGGRKLPGVLHIHGGGQTAALVWAQYWAKRGYACVTFDFCGKWPGHPEYTEWGPIAHANMAQAAGGYQMAPTPRASSWYHWAVASRRALTLLAHHPAVDPKRLGIFGVSVGGTLTWIVAGSDPRVRAAVPIYGCGYNVDPRKKSWGLGEPNADQLLYKRTLSPEAHAPYIRCPLLFLSASNDHHGWMDDAYEALAAVRAPVRQAFTPRYIHHLEPEEGADLPLWMDHYLKSGAAWPESPLLRVEVGSDRVPRAVLPPYTARDVETVRAYYTLGEEIPQARFWRRVVVTRHGSEWQAALPVMDVREPVRAFANVTYRSGVTLSSNLARAVPGQLGKASATLSWTPIIDNGSAGYENWYYLAAYTDPNLDKRFFRALDAAEGRPGFTLNPELFGEPMEFQIGTHLLADPQFRGPSGNDSMALALDCRGGWTEKGLTVEVVQGSWRPTQRVYAAHLEPAALSTDWKTVILPLSRFQAADGSRPASWGTLNALQLRGAASRKAPPCIGPIRWVKEP